MRGIMDCMADNTIIPTDTLKGLCRKWKIKELSLFGSVVRGDMRPDSDIDVLVELEPDHNWGWEIFDLQDELSALLGGRTVDLVFKSGLRNPLRRRHILESRRVLYAA